MRWRVNKAINSILWGFSILASFHLTVNCDCIFQLISFFRDPKRFRLSLWEFFTANFMCENWLTRRHLEFLVNLTGHWSDLRQIIVMMMDCELIFWIIIIVFLTIIIVINSIHHPTRHRKMINSLIMSHQVYRMSIFHTHFSPSYLFSLAAAYCKRRPTAHDNRISVDKF